MIATYEIILTMPCHVVYIETQEIDNIPVVN